MIRVILGNGISIEKFRFLQIGWNRAKKKFHVEGKLTQVVTFLKLTGSANIEPTRLRGMIGAWNNSYLPGNIRTFLFKFYNNIRGLNVKVSKFNPLIDPSCTFCSNRNFRPAERESFAHLFFYCETTQVILAEFFKRYFTINVPEISVFFCGTVSNKERENRAF